MVAVVGPTAAGKSALAIALARRLGGEIVNADSMQVYRGMDIGTAKPPVAERAEIPHHLVDILEVDQTATVAQFQRLARDAIDGCRRRGAVPLVVGGSALYVRAILDRFEFPGTDPAIRSRLEAELGVAGPATLHARLARVDPEAAERILPTNGRRLVRALEVIELTGCRFSANLPGHEYAYADVRQIGLDVDRATLDARIERRVRRMWQAGLVAEVRGLADRGLRDGVTASRALGYRQLLAFLDGSGTEAEALDATVRATRRFARRQDSWFRKDPRIHWLAHDDPELVDRALRLCD